MIRSVSKEMTRQKWWLNTELQFQITKIFPPSESWVSVGGPFIEAERGKPRADLLHYHTIWCTSSSRPYRQIGNFQRSGKTSKRFLWLEAEVHTKLKFFHINWDWHYIIVSKFRVYHWQNPNNFRSCMDHNISLEPSSYTINFIIPMWISQSSQGTRNIYKWWYF